MQIHCIVQADGNVFCSSCQQGDMDICIVGFLIMFSCFLFFFFPPTSQPLLSAPCLQLAFLPFPMAASPHKKVWSSCVVPTKQSIWTGGLARTSRGISLFLVSPPHTIFSFSHPSTSRMPIFLFFLLVPHVSRSICFLSCICFLSWALICNEQSNENCLIFHRLYSPFHFIKNAPLNSCVLAHSEEW